MHIVEVIPLGKGIPAEQLSYFSPTPYIRGVILNVPLRRTTTPAVVVASHDAFSMKTALRAATFSLRRLPAQEPHAHLSHACMETAEYVARYHATSIGAVFSAILPKELREGRIALSPAPPQEELPPPSHTPHHIIAPTADRYIHYERMVRESFAAKRSVLFVVPTIEYASRLSELLSPGIPEYTVLLHGGMRIDTLRTYYERLTHESHPLLIIATPLYSLAERHDLGMIVIEHERSHGYHGRVRPYLDYRVVLRTYAAKRGISCIYADSVPRTEEVAELYDPELPSLEQHPKRLELPGSLRVITPSRTEEPHAHVPPLFSEELKESMSAALSRKGRVFLFSARRGLAPLVICVDCGEILRDPESGAPLSLMHTTTHGVEKRWLVSTVSGYRHEAHDLCPVCGSWRLRERGIGIQHAYTELTKLYDSDAVILFDHQTASTHKKATHLKERFYARKKTILLGTALALPYLELPVSLSAILSMDSLRAIPTWRQQEEIFSILMTLREKTLGDVIVQTKMNDTLLTHAGRGALNDFYQEEIHVRTHFNYPPFFVFIHFAWKERSRDRSIKKTLGEVFAPYNISLYSAFDDTGKAHQPHGVIHYGLIRIPRDRWPDAVLIGHIRSLPPDIRVMINPDRII